MAGDNTGGMLGHVFGHQAPLTRLYEAARAACLALVAFVERAVVRYPGQIQIMDFEGFS